MDSSKHNDLTQGSSCVPLRQRLAEQFYQWEGRGRGWLLWEKAVRPEPPYAPFHGYQLHDDAVEDNGRRQTWISGLTQWASRLLTRNGKPHGKECAEEAEPSDNFDHLVLSEPAALVELQITLPASSKVDEDIAEQFLLSLASCRHPLAFEVVGLPEETVVQLVCADRDVGHVRSQLQAHFADASFKENDRLLADR